MDSLDVQIMRKLGAGGRSEFDPFPTGLNSIRYVGGEIGIDKETVRKRLKNLRETGLLMGWSAMINPNILSLKATRIWLDFSNPIAREAAVKELSKINEVRTITVYYGTKISYIFVYDDYPNRLSNHLVEIARRSSSFQKLRSAILSFPECKVRLSNADLKMYENTRRSFQKSQVDIARESGVALRTVKRRLGSLREKNALLVVSALDPSKVEGICAEIFLEYRHQASSRVLNQSEGGIISKVSDSLLSIEPHESATAALLLMMPNLAKAINILKMVASNPEVSFAELNLIQEIVRVRDRLRLKTFL